MQAEWHNKWSIKPVYEYLLLTAITLLAAGLRLYKLGEWSFWWDEMYTIQDSLGIIERGLSISAPTFYLIHYALDIFGVNEWGARIMPALVGIITIPILYFPTRRIFNLGTAFLAALFLAISPWHIYWSQNARFYTTLLLFFSLAYFFFYIWLETDRFINLILAGIFLGLAVLERGVALFLIPIAASYWILVWLLPFEKPAGLRVKNLILVMVLGFIILVYFAGWIIFEPSRITEINRGWVNNNPFWILAGVAFYIGLPFLCMGLVGGIYQLFQKDRATLHISLVAILPVIFIMILSLIQYTANRYIFISLYAWILLASIAIYGLLVKNPGLTRVLAFGAFLVLLFHSMAENVLYYQYQNGNRDDWKSAFAFIENRIEPGDLVVSANPLIAEYYLQEDVIDMAKADVNELLKQGQRIWLVEDFNTQEKWPEVHDWMVKNTRLRAVFDVHVQARNYTLRVYLFDPQDK